jgi:hypothetical protein
MADPDQKEYDQSKYTTRTLSTFSIVGSYYIDLFYNHLYFEGQKLWQANPKAVSSHTHGYQHAISRFLSVINQKRKATYSAKLYMDMLKGVNTFFTTHSRFATLTLKEFRDTLLSEVLPPQIFEHMTDDDRRGGLREILVTVIQKFTVQVTTKYMSAIIDNHDNSANIPLLQEVMTNLFIEQREIYYQKQIDLDAGEKGHEKVDVSLMRRMQAENRQLLVNQNKLSDACRQLSTQRDSQRNNAQLLLDRYKVAVKKIKLLEAENTQLRRQLAEPRDIPVPAWGMPLTRPDPPSPMGGAFIVDGSDGSDEELEELDDVDAGLGGFVTAPSPVARHQTKARRRQTPPKTQARRRQSPQKPQVQARPHQSPPKTHVSGGPEMKGAEEEPSVAEKEALLQAHMKTGGEEPTEDPVIKRSPLDALSNNVKPSSSRMGSVPSITDVFGSG